MMPITAVATRTMSARHQLALERQLRGSRDFKMPAKQTLQGSRHYKRSELRSLRRFLVGRARFGLPSALSVVVWLRLCLVGRDVILCPD